MAASPITWHAGHRSIHDQLGWSKEVANSLRHVTDYLPSWHRLLYRHTVPFLPLVVLDEHERPWASIAVARSGKPGFVTRSSETELEMIVDVHPADPFYAALQFASARGQRQSNRTYNPLNQRNVDPFAESLNAGSGNSSSIPPQLIAAMGIDFAERTRTKFAGNILGAEQQQDGLWKVRLEVTQALGQVPTRWGWNVLIDLL